MTAHPITIAGGVFQDLHRRLAGPPVDIQGLDIAAIPGDLLGLARATWRQRASSEFRSIQIMIRFLSEIVGAGEPLDVYSGAVDLITDEIRHAELCAAVCKVLGAPAQLPEPVALMDAPGFLSAPMSERALATAITMLGINETISVGYIADLAARCQTPGIREVLTATIGDEQEHEDFGWTYIRRALQRFPAASLGDWRHLVGATVQPHETSAGGVLAHVPIERRRLDAWPEPELVALGLFSPQRQALVYRRTWEQVLKPRLQQLDLWDQT